MVTGELESSLQVNFCVIMGRFRYYSRRGEFVTKTDVKKDQETDVNIESRDHGTDVNLESRDHGTAVFLYFKKDERT